MLDRRKNEQFCAPGPKVDCTSTLWIQNDLMMQNGLPSSPCAQKLCNYECMGTSAHPLLFSSNIIIFTQDHGAWNGHEDAGLFYHVTLECMPNCE